jgi:hypothetical protein
LSLRGMESAGADSLRIRCRHGRGCPKKTLIPSTVGCCPVNDNYNSPPGIRCLTTDVTVSTSEVCSQISKLSEQRGCFRADSSRPAAVEYLGAPGGSISRPNLGRRTQQEISEVGAFPTVQFRQGGPQRGQDLRLGFEGSVGLDGCGEVRRSGQIFSKECVKILGSQERYASVQTCEDFLQFQVGPGTVMHLVGTGGLCRQTAMVV